MIARTFVIVAIAGSGACFIPDHGFDPSADAAELTDAIDQLDGSLDAGNDGPIQNDASLGRIVLQPSPLAVMEGQSAMLDVVLDSPPPLGATTVTLSTVAPIVDVTPMSLVFTSGNWSTPQQATVMALHDADTTAGQTEIQATATDFLTGMTTVNVADDDTLMILASVSTLTVAEGSSGNFTVRLSAQPSATVSVAIARAGTEINVAPALMTFTVSNYDTPQVVTVQGLEDADITDDADLVQLSASGVPQTTVPVTVVDND